MPKGQPVIRKGNRCSHAATLISSAAHMIYSHRIAKKMTQRQLANAINSYITKTGNTVISEWERGFSLPGVTNIFLLSEVLDIEREPFFNIILREYYDRFLDAHHEMFCKYALIIERDGSDENIDYKKFEGRYYFCTKGKINYHFSKFSGIMKECCKKKNLTKAKLVRKLRRPYSRARLSAVIGGYRVPSLKIIVDLSEYFGLNAFDMYKVMVKEKAFCHAKNMIQQWELYKAERINNE